MIIKANDSLKLEDYSKRYNLPLLTIILANNLKSNRNMPTYIKIPGYSMRQIANPYDISIVSKELLPEVLRINQVNTIEQLQRKVNIFIPHKEDQYVYYEQPYTYNVLCHDQQRLIDLYPFIQKHSIGYSVCGKEINELTIGSGPKKLHINAAMHGNEWITAAILMNFFNEYAFAITNPEHIWHSYMMKSFKNVTLSIVPMVNPDGVDLAINGSNTLPERSFDLVKINKGRTDFSNWKANIRGVDLNKQFPALWDIEASRFNQIPAARDYSGSEPLTEPEAKALVQLVKDRNFHRVISLHTQGEEIYWHFGKNIPAESKYISEEFARVSGYQNVKHLDNYAGFKDWFIQEYNRPGFTIELGRGVNPLSLEKFTNIYMKVKRILLANLYIK